MKTVKATIVKDDKKLSLKAVILQDDERTIKNAKSTLFSKIAQILEREFGYSVDLMFSSNLNDIIKASDIQKKINDIMNTITYQII